MDPKTPKLQKKGLFLKQAFLWGSVSAGVAGQRKSPFSKNDVFSAQSRLQKQNALFWTTSQNMAKIALRGFFSLPSHACRNEGVLTPFRGSKPIKGSFWTVWTPFGGSKGPFWVILGPQRGPKGVLRPFLTILDPLQGVIQFFPNSGPGDPPGPPGGPPGGHLGPQSIKRGYKGPYL